MGTVERSVAPAGHMEIGAHAAGLKEEDVLSVRTALYFYSIIVFSFLLPVAVAVGLVFTILALKIILSILCLSLLGGLWFAYRRITAQLRALRASAEPQSLDQGECRVSLPGGVIEVSVEPKRPEPRLVRTGSTDGAKEEHSAAEPRSES